MIFALFKEIALVAGVTVAASSIAGETGPVEELQSVLTDVRHGTHDVARGLVEPIFAEIIEALERRP